jgi:hypothetical protein
MESSFFTIADAMTWASKGRTDDGKGIRASFKMRIPFEFIGMPGS